MFLTLLVAPKEWRKVNPGRWELAVEVFVAGQKLLQPKKIRRRRPSKQQMESLLRNGTSVFYGQSESLNEVDNLEEFLEEEQGALSLSLS